MGMFEIMKKLAGLQTAESVARALKVKKRTAINYIWKLRKKGYVEYYSAGRNKRIYKIGIKPKFDKEKDLYEFINKYSKIKVGQIYRHIIHEKLSPEKAIVLALKSGNFRLILASLNLFRKIENWKMLNNIAKKNNLQRQIGALYDLARKFIKVRRIDKRIRNSILLGKGEKYIYYKIKTKDFKDIAKIWRVEIPFKKEDLMRLKIG